MPTTPSGFIPALELDRVADGDFLAMRDALFKLWDGFNREIGRQPLVTDLFGALADEPAGLTAADANFLFYVTDYNHLVRWDGAAWRWGPGDSGNDYFGMFRVAPSANGWQLCDGTATTRLTVGGATLSTTAFTTPNVTAGTFLKILAAYTGTIEAAIAAVLSGSTGSIAPGLSGSTGTEASHTHSGPNHTHSVNGTPSIEVAVQSGVGTTVAGAGHTHGLTTADGTGSTGAGSAHDHGVGTLVVASHNHGVGTLVADAAGRPPSLGTLLYYRR